MEPLVGRGDLRRISGSGEHLGQKLVRIKRDRGHQLLELLCAERLLRGLDGVLLRLVVGAVGWLIVALIRIALIRRSLIGRALPGVLLLRLGVRLLVLLGLGSRLTVVLGHGLDMAVFGDGLILWRGLRAVLRLRRAGLRLIAVLPLLFRLGCGLRVVLGELLRVGVVADLDAVLRFGQVEVARLGGVIVGLGSFLVPVAVSGLRLRGRRGGSRLLGRAGVGLICGAAEVGVEVALRLHGLRLRRGGRGGLRIVVLGGCELRTHSG